MKDYAIYLYPRELNYFTPVIKTFPPQSLDIHISHNNKQKISFSDFAQDIRDNISQLRDLSYTVREMDVSCFEGYRGVALTNIFFEPGASNMFNWPENYWRPRLAGFYHQSGRSFFSEGRAPSYYFMASTRQAEIKEAHKVSRRKDPDLFMKLRRLPQNKINEFTYTGPFHLGEWLERRHLPRELLRGELEEKMHCSFDPNKPVVAYFENFRNDPAEQRVALERLAQNVNLVTKLFTEGDTIKGAYVWPDSGYAPNLLRFASDFILASYRSGTFASSTMLGLRVIPYYTPTTYLDVPRTKRVPYTHYLAPNFNKEDINSEIIDKLNPLFNILDTGALLDRLGDAAWWLNYEENLPAAQNDIFGSYDMDDAVNRTSNLLKRVFEEESLGEDTVALKIR